MRLIIPLLFIYSIFSFSQNHDENVSLQRKAVRVSKKMRNAILDNLDEMSNKELSKVIRLMRKTTKIAKGIDYEDQEQTLNFIAAIKMENQAFTIESHSVTDFFSQCKLKAKQLSTDLVNDVSVKVLGAQKKTYHLSYGFFSNEVTKCLTATQLAVKSALSSNIKVDRVKYLIYGYADGTGIIAFGNTIGELERSCIQSMKGSGDFLANDISIQLNDGKKKTAHKSYGFWKDAPSLCNTAISLII